MTSDETWSTIPAYMDPSYPYASSYAPDSFTPPPAWEPHDPPSTQPLYPSYLINPTLPSSSSSSSHRRPRSLEYPSEYPQTSGPSSTSRWYCTFTDCEFPSSDRVFTRKSDWKRHTDKHTRPYRCPYPGCADLAGFGWIGGLNRHLEELHNSAAQHKCPYEDCKRHEKGFNRSANLKNHIKKVHNVDMGSEAGGSESGGERRRERDGRERLVAEIRDVERELARAEREEQEANRRRMEVVQRLRDLRGELEDGWGEGY